MTRNVLHATTRPFLGKAHQDGARTVEVRPPVSSSVTQPGLSVLSASLAAPNKPYHHRAHPWLGPTDPRSWVQTCARSRGKLCNYGSCRDAESASVRMASDPKVSCIHDCFVEGLALPRDAWPQQCFCISATRRSTG